MAKLKDAQILKLKKILKEKAKVKQETIDDYVAEVQKSTSTKIKSLELTIAKALATNQSTKFGWANRPNKSDSVLVEAKSGIILKRENASVIQRTDKVTHKSVGLIDFTKMKPHLREEEGVINHFYLDGNGELTIGVGHLVDETALTMKGWPFTDKNAKKGKPTTITTALVQADIDAVEKATSLKSTGGAAYEAKTNLRLADRKIDELLEVDFGTERTKAVTRYPDLKTFPESVQFGIIDLTYLGGGTSTKWPSFYKAVKRRDWQRAAKESQVTKGSFDKERNKTRLDKLKKGAETDLFFTTDPEKTNKLLEALLKL